MIDFDADPDGVVDLTLGTATSKTRRTATDEDNAAMDEIYHESEEETGGYSGVGAERELGDTVEADEGVSYLDESGDHRARTAG